MTDMSDLTLTRSGELDVTQIEGNTDEGVDFVDALYLATMEVVDAGRVIVPTGEVAAIEQSAREAGLTIERDVLELS